MIILGICIIFYFILKDLLLSSHFWEDRNWEKVKEFHPFTFPSFLSISFLEKLTNKCVNYSFPFLYFPLQITPPKLGINLQQLA